MKTLETERLILRAYTEEDAQGLYEYAKDPDVGPRAGWKPHESAEESREIIRTMFMPVEAWAIFLKEDGRLIGTIGLENDRHRDENSREIGYSLAKDMWGRGLMTEACREVVRFAFEELGLALVGICTAPDNERSQGVIRKCGFVYEGTIRHSYETWTGVCRDSRCYSMLREEAEELGIVDRGATDKQPSARTKSE